MVILGLFLNNEVRTGGNRRYLELMESLAERGNRVVVIMNPALDYRPSYFSRLDLSVRYRRKGFPPASFLFSVAVRRNLATLLDYLGEAGSSLPEWILIHGDLHLKAAMFLKERLGARLFFAYRCNDVDRSVLMRAYTRMNARDRILSRLHEVINRANEKKVAKVADLVTFQNTDDREAFLRRTGANADATIIIPGNIGLPRFDPAWENRNASVAVSRLVYVGVLSATKGIQYALKACAILKERGYGHLRLAVLGKTDGAEKTISLVRELGIEDMVSFEGYALPFPYFAECDLFVYPSIYDAFPDTILESLHVGCPVIASRVGGIPDMLAHDELLFESGDSAGIADMIEACVRDPSRYLRMKKLCAERANAYRFDWAEAWERAMGAFTRKHAPAGRRARES